MKIKIIVALFLFSFLSLLNLFAAESQTWPQHEELFYKGTITDSSGKVWNVRFVPGVYNINKNMMRAWEDSGETIGDLFDEYFYARWVKKTFLDGIEFAFDSSWGIFWAKGVNKDWEEVVQVWNEEDTFGGSIGKFVGLSWFGLKFILRTVVAPCGTVLGITYATVAPTTAVASRPLKAAYEAFVKGGVVPSVLYVWNGTAWVATYFSDVPEKEGVFVKLVSKDGKTLVVDKRGFNTILIKSVLQHLNSEQKRMVENKIATMVETTKQDNGTADNSGDKTQETLEILMNSAWKRVMKMPGNKIAEVTLDNGSLERLVREFLKEIGQGEPVDALVKEIVDTDVAAVEALIERPIS